MRLFFRDIFVAAIAGVILGTALSKLLEERWGPEHENVVQVQPPAEAVAGLWAVAQACAGDLRDTTQRLQDVAWFVRDPVPVYKFLTETDTILGEWKQGSVGKLDTIYLSRGWENSPLIITHELVHHALAGGGNHPAAAFDRCDL